MAQLTAVYLLKRKIVEIKLRNSQALAQQQLPF